MVDGVVYATMVGLGEVYFLADAIRLGASPLVQGLVVFLPLFAGSLGPVISLRLLGRMRARKPLVVGAVLGQAATLLALGLGDALGVSSPSSLLAQVCLYQVFGQAAGTPWSSWFGDLVPGRIRGRYFARRTRAVHLATCLGLLLGGLVLQVLEPGRAAEALAESGSGFALLFAAAACFRFGSAGLLAASAEPPFRGLPARARVARYLSGERGTAAWRLVVLVALLQLTVYVASPYFQPFMLEKLRFGYLEYMAASMTVVVVKVAVLPAWGTLIDQYGARRLFALAALLLAFVPLPWVWANGLAWVVVAQAFSGFCWAGFEVAQFSLLLESSYRSTRLHVFAALSVATGLGQLLGGLTGVLLAGRGVELRTLFALSFAARLLVGVSLVRLLPEGRRRVPVRRRDLLLRVIGVRPSGGVVHRPLAAQVPAEEEDGIVR